MFKIVRKEELNQKITLFEVLAPQVAHRAAAGQFIMLMLDEKGERIPLTIYESDREKGTISIVVQSVGKTTEQLNLLPVGHHLHIVLGPLGKPARIRKYGRVLAVAGGVGVAEIIPVVRALKSIGNHMTCIVGARSRHLLLLEHELRATSDALYITTDDGSVGVKGFVTDVLRDILKDGLYDMCYCVGPLPMMQSVAEVTKIHNLRTFASLSTIMLDGTGICGACRVTVGGKTSFACVDGPEFDAHQVDFQELIERNNRFLDKERKVLEAYAKTRS